MTMNQTPEAIISWYRQQGAPGDQAALVSMLEELQDLDGGTISPATAAQAAEALKVKETYLRAVIKRFPRLRLDEGHTLELCAGPNCGKSRRLADCAEQLRKTHGFTLKFVPCMRLCGKGPNLKWDGKLHHGATEDLLKDLVK